MNVYEVKGGYGVFAGRKLRDQYLSASGVMFSRRGAIQMFDICLLTLGLGYWGYNTCIILLQCGHWKRTTARRRDCSLSACVPDHMCKRRCVDGVGDIMFMIMLLNALKRKGNLCILFNILSWLLDKVLCRPRCSKLFNGIVELSRVVAGLSHCYGQWQDACYIKQF